MSSTVENQCRALTGDGERCGRPAEQNGFCYQHDESDPTVDAEGDDESAAETDDSSDTGDDGDSDEGDEVDDLEDGDGAGGTERPDSELVEVRKSVVAIGRDLIGHELDGIIGVSSDGDGWQATVEVVERSAVPDTQDIIGQYEIKLDSDHAASGYHRLDRYRRGDTNRDEVL